jgi:chemotaxis protein histidine kinase CheA
MSKKVHGHASPSLVEGLAEVWQRTRPLLMERVEAIERAVAELSGTPMKRSRVEVGCAEAHKLAGTLGTFGLDRGTELARELEQSLDQPRPREADHLESIAAELRLLVEGIGS